MLTLQLEPRDTSSNIFHQTCIQRFPQNKTKTRGDNKTVKMKINKEMLKVNRDFASVVKIQMKPLFHTIRQQIN